MKKSAATLVLAMCATVAQAATQKTPIKTPGIGSGTLVVGQGNHLLETVNGVLAINPEFTTLLSLGTLFIGAAAVFSLRRPTI